MVNINVEKEIDRDHRVMGGFTKRQLICVAAAGVLSLLSSALCGWDVDLAVYPISICAVICGLFGWYKPNGEPFEKFLLNKIRVSIYHGDKRKYRTKNRYVTMMNAEYNRRKKIDDSNKELAKKMKSDAKGKKSAPEKSAYTPIK